MRYITACLIGEIAQAPTRVLRRMPILSVVNAGIMRDVPTLDPTDARLLLELAANPRASGVELAQKLGLSRNTVQARLAKWDAAGALGSVERRVNPRALGYPLAAFVAVVVDQHRLDAVAAELADIAEVTEVCGLAGLTDLIVRVVARDTDGLYRVAGQILRIPGVERTNMSLVMQELVGPRISPLLQQLARSRTVG